MEQILILTGAGVSQESGIAVFRGAKGLWAEHKIEDVCSVEAFTKDRDRVNSFYDERRLELERAEPNLAHKVLTKLKNKYPDKIAMITQNVDDLLERAGCKDVLHLHGTLLDLRCESCSHVFNIGFREQKSDEVCPECGSFRIRHNVVMFGEQAPQYQLLDKVANSAEMLIVIGSSGQVLPIAWMAQWFEKSILNNLDPDENLDSHFKRVIHKKATEAILEIEQEIESFLSS